MRRWIAALLAAPALLATAVGADRDLFEEAERRYRSGNYSFALEAYEQLVDRYPLSDYLGESQLRRGIALIRLGRSGDAVPILDSIRARYPAARELRHVPFWLGVALFHEHELTASANLLREFATLATEPADRQIRVQALWYLGRVEVARDRPASALAPLSQLLALGADSASRSGDPAAPRDAAAVLLAFAYSVLHDHDEVIALTTRIAPAELAPRWRSQYLAYRGEALWQTGQIEAAERAYTELLTLLDIDRGAESAALRRLFAAARRRGDLRAMDAYSLDAEARFRAQPEILVDFWLRLGIDNQQRGSSDLADLFLRRVWSRGGSEREDTVAALYLAENMLSRERPDAAADRAAVAAAARLLEEYLGRQPPDAWRVATRLGDLLLQLGDFALAASRYGEALAELRAVAADSHEELARAGYLLAYAEFRAGAPDAALASIAAALADANRMLVASDRPRGQGGTVLADLLRLRTVVVTASADLASALAASRAYLEIAPADEAGQVDHLRLLFRDRRWTDLQKAAAALLGRSLQARTRLTAMYLSGVAAVAQGNAELAEDRLAAIEPEQAVAAGLAIVVPYVDYYHGWALFELGQLEAAGEALLTVAAAYAEHPIGDEARFLAGEAWFAAGDYARAAEAFAGLTAADSPFAPRAMFLLGRSRANRGDLPGAIAAFRTLQARFPDDERADDGKFELAGLLAQAGETRAAADLYLDLSRRVPRSSLVEDAAFRRAEILLDAELDAAAYEAFADYRREFPGGRFEDSALYWGGVVAQRRGEVFGAVLLWELLLERSPDSPLSTVARRAAAEVYIAQGDLSPALAHLEALVAAAGDSTTGRDAAARASEVRFLMQGLGDREAQLAALIGGNGGAATETGRAAMLELARLYIFQRDVPVELAALMLDDVVEAAEAELQRAEATLLLGEYHRRRGQPERAAQAFLDAAVLAAGAPDIMAISLLRGAEMLLLVGRAGDARALAARIERLFPGSIWESRAEELFR